MLFFTYIADTQVSVDYNEDKNTITINSIHTFDGRPLVTSRTPELENAVISQIRVKRYEETKATNEETNEQAPKAEG